MLRRYGWLTVVCALGATGCTEMFRGLYDPIPPYDPDARGVVEERRRNMPPDMPEDMPQEPDVPRDMPAPPVDMPPDLDMPPDMPEEMSPLPAPQGVQALGSPERVTVSWLPVDGAERYDVRIDGGAWIPVGTATTYEDDAAGAPTIASVTVAASDGTSDAQVDLVATVNAEPGVARAYQVRAIVGAQVTQISESVEGAREPGEATVEWERTVGSNQNTRWEPMMPATTALTRQDADAPVSGEPRFYRVRASVAGVEGNPLSPPDEGYRLAVRQISVSKNHACALLSTGEVKCWGEGSAALGNETGNDITVSSTGPPPPVVNLGGRAIKVVAGLRHTCALMESRDVVCWGDGVNGVLGSGDERVIGDMPGDMPPPVVNVGGDAKDLQTSGLHNCVLLNNNQIRCWGQGTFAALGNGSNNPVGNGTNQMPPSPTQVSQVISMRVARTFLSAGAHTCTTNSLRQVYCWGANLAGQLGIGSRENIGDSLSEMPPANVTDVGGSVQMLALGFFWSCAIVNNRVRCWGRPPGETSVASQIGDGMGEMPPPIVDLGSRTPSTIFAGEDHACTILQGGEVICWGSNDEGQLGYGDQVARPAFSHGRHRDLVPLGGGAVELSLGDTSSCAIMDDHKVKCWGDGVGDAPGEMPPPTLKLW